VDQQVTLFDAALQLRFHQASKAGGDFDLRTIFDGTLVAARPDHAVTLVDNHDTQPLQALEAPVEPWFKPLAYALILLREGGRPACSTPTSMARSTAIRAMMARRMTSICPLSIACPR
jgi:alpha-amylase